MKSYLLTAATLWIAHQFSDKNVKFVAVELIVVNSPPTFT